MELSDNLSPEEGIIQIYEFDESQWYPLSLNSTTDHGSQPVVTLDTFPELEMCNYFLVKLNPEDKSVPQPLKEIFFVYPESQPENVMMEQESYSQLSLSPELLFQSTPTDSQSSQCSTTEPMEILLSPAKSVLNPRLDGTFKCPYCNSVFSNRSMVWRHEKIHGIGIEEDDVYKCPVEGCHVQYTNKTTLTKHRISEHGYILQRSQTNRALKIKRRLLKN